MNKKWFNLLLLIAFANVQAQVKLYKPGNDFDFERPYHKWGITLGGNIYPFYDARPEPSPAMLIPRWYLMWGFHAGLAYRIGFSNHFGLKLNLLAERMPVYSYRLFIPADETPDNQNFYADIGNKYAPFSFHLPVGLEYRNFLIRHYILFARAGVDIGYSLGFNESKRHNTHFLAAYINKPGWQYGMHFSLGWYYQFPWALWETGFVYRKNFNRAYSGIYLVDNYRTVPSNAGWLGQSGDYIGLQFTWYFKKRFVGDDARCPGQVHSKAVLKRKRAQQRAKEKARRRNERMKRKLMRNKRRKQHKKKKKRFLIF